MRLRELGEFGLISKLRAFAGEGLLAAVGEDAAVFDVEGARLLLTADLLVEGVHFRREYTTPELLGGKALAVNLSDLAACGAVPLIYTVSLVVSPEEEWSFIEGLYRGMTSQGERYGARLGGGDISRGETLTISVALLGRAPEGKVVLRGGASEGDLLYVSGWLGEAALGLELLRRGEGEGPFVRRHLLPSPRLELGRELASRGLATAMIDLSDGLLQDMGHLLSESGKGAVVDLDRLPVSEALRLEAHRLGLDPLDLALAGGEDYELLFSSRPELEGEVEALSRELSLPLTAIGRVTGAELVLLRQGQRYRFEGSGGYDHLR